MPEAYQINVKASSKSEIDPSIFQNLSLVTTVPKPHPGHGEVLVRIKAASLNFRDLLMIADSPKYPIPPTPGLVPCSDGAGEIEAVGPDSVWHVGDKVLLPTNTSWHHGPDVRIPPKRCRCRRTQA